MVEVEDLVALELVLRCSPLSRLYCWRSRSEREEDVDVGRVLVVVLVDGVVAGVAEGCVVVALVAGCHVLFSRFCHS